MLFHKFAIFALLIHTFPMLASAKKVGSLAECGESNNFNVISEQNWNLTFHCPKGFECIDKVCQNEQNATVPSVIDRCNTKTDKCQSNIDIGAHCGFAFKRQDGWTYYFNCPIVGGCSKSSLTCSKNEAVLITRCNETDLWVEGGECLNICPENLKCENIIPVKPVQA